jgi:hypothetical protein
LMAEQALHFTPASLPSSNWPSAYKNLAAQTSCHLLVTSAGSYFFFFLVGPFFSMESSLRLMTSTQTSSELAFEDEDPPSKASRVLFQVGWGGGQIV